EDQKSPIKSSASLAGSFAKSGSDYKWALDGRGSVSIAGFLSTGMNFSLGENGSDHWFTLDGEIKAGPVTAGLSGDVSWGNGLNFNLAGTASMRMFGATTVNAAMVMTYATSTKLVQRPGFGAFVLDRETV